MVASVAVAILDEEIYPDGLVELYGVKPNAFCFPLKVLQSAADKAPRLPAEAVGKLKV